MPKVDARAEPPDVLVRADRLSRTYGSDRAAVAALRDASFEIRAGDGIALVGPSGSGKTTLLHLMAALDQPTAGFIEWPALGLADALRPGPVALAFQGPSLLPPLTVEENVELTLLLLDRPQEEARWVVDRMLKQFGLLDVRNKLPEELSGGQSQRAGLARALAGGPRLLLADEPTGQQDRVTAELVMNVLLDAVEEAGIALLLATHDAHMAARMGVRWEMRNGLLHTGVGTSSR